MNVEEALNDLAIMYAKILRMEIENEQSTNENVNN